MGVFNMDYQIIILIIHLMIIKTAKNVSGSDGGTFDFEFDRGNVGVLFHPLVAPLGYEADMATTTKEHCSEEDVIPLLEKVKTRFSTIAFKTTEKRIDQISYYCVPLAVAKMNKVWEERGEGTMKVWLLDSVAPLYVQTESDFTGRLQNLSELVKQANEEFKGTVPGLFLDYYSYIHDNSESQAKTNAENHLDLALNMLSRDVQVGLILSNSYCEKLERGVKEGKELQSFMLKADLVLFADFEVELPTDQDAAQFALTTYTRCVDGLAPHIKEKPVIGVFTAWTATSPSGITSYSGFVSVWKALNDWAKQKQRPLLMWGAFDGLTKSNIPWSTLGWWRLKPNSSYVSTADYQFIEKKDLAERSGERTDPMGNHTFLYPTRTYFSREYFGVAFDPFVHLWENGVRGRQVPIHSLIRQISSRFSRIRPPVILDEDVHFSIIQLMSFVPKFNKNATNPMEIVLSFGVSSKAKGQAAFEKTLKLASEANAKFPGTVKQVILDSTSGDKEASEQILVEVLTSARNSLSSSEEKFKLGAIVDSSACLRLLGKGDGKEKDTIPLLAPLVSNVLLNYHTPAKKLHLGVERVVPDIIAAFEKCSRRIRSTFQEVEDVTLITNWHDTDGKRQNFVQLVNFWEKLNAWASDTHSHVIVNEAIDNPNHGMDVNQGWWRYVENKTQINVDDIILEEKKFSE